MTNWKHKSSNLHYAENYFCGVSFIKYQRTEELKNYSFSIAFIIISTYFMRYVKKKQKNKFDVHFKKKTSRARMVSLQISLTKAEVATRGVLCKKVFLEIWHTGKLLSQSLFFKGTQMQIWKFHYMFVFIEKQYPENLGFLILRILKLFISEFCKFLRK